MKYLVQKRVDIARDRATGKLSTELAYMQLISAIDEFEKRSKVKPVNAVRDYYGGRNLND